MTDYNAKDDVENDVPIWRVVDEADQDVYDGKVVFLSKLSAMPVIRHLTLQSKIEETA